MRLTFLRNLVGMSIGLLFMGGGITSCNSEDKADDAVPRLKVDTYEVTLANNGRSPLDKPVTFRVIANKGYEITSDQQWLHVDQPTGAGMIDVLITTDLNDTGAERTGSLFITSGNLHETLAVKQTPNDPDPMRIFYHEDFEWLIPFAKENSDPVADNKGNSNRTSITASPVKEAWATCGLTDFNLPGNGTNAYHHYIHFNNNFKKYHPEYATYDAGVILPRLDLGTETVDAIVTVVMSPDGSVASGLDVIPLTVTIESGKGYVGTTGKSKVGPIVTPPTVMMMWSTYEFTLREITADTRIAVRSYGNQNDYCRWFLNEITVKETRL